MIVVASEGVSVFSLKDPSLTGSGQDLSCEGLDSVGTLLVAIPGDVS
jgi:hypothetical protein